MDIPIAVGTAWREGDDWVVIKSFSRIQGGYIYDIESTGPNGTRRGVRFNLDPKELEPLSIGCGEKE